MALLSDAYSLDGTLFSSISVTGQIDWSSAVPATSPAYTDGQGADAKYTGETRSAIDITLLFKHTGYTPRRDLRRLIDFPKGNRWPRTLVVYSGDDASPALVTNDATVTSYDTSQAGQTTVVFRVPRPEWTAVTPTTLGPYAFAASGSQALTVDGELTVTPLLKLGWSVQRATPTAHVGWGYRRRITVTNTLAQSLRNHPLQLGPINTAALVAASKLQSDGDDLVVFDDTGKRLRRLAAGFNSRGTFLWFVIPELAAGASKTFDVGYGNSAAAHDATANGFPYTYPGSPSVDTSGLDGQATAGAASTISTGVTVDPNRFVYSTILLVAATGAVAGGQYRRIASHTTGGVYTMTRAWTTNPDTNTGYVIAGSGFMGDGGQASATAAGSLTDAAQSWGAGEWVGATVEIITLDATIGTVVQSATVTASTPTQLSVASWPSGTPSATALYRVWRKNGNWHYRVSQDKRSDTSHRGRWRLSAGLTKPAQMWFRSDGSAGAWALTTYNPADASNDYSQKRVTSTDVGAGDIDHFAVLNASIARKDGARLTEEGYANGCELYAPTGILGAHHDFQIKNPSGMARAVFGARERGGEDWSLYKEYSTAQASLTLIATAYYDLTGYGTPLHLLAALTSDDDADIEKTQTSTANLQDGNVLRVVLASSGITVTDWDAATEDIVYDMTLTVREGAATEADGDSVVVVGSSDDTAHVFVEATEEVWVGPVGDRPLVTRLYDVSFTDPDASDTFTEGAGGVTVQAHTPSGGGTWTEHTSSGAGDATIDGNRAHNANSSTVHILYHSWTPAAPADGSYGVADYDVKADVVMRSDNNLSTAGPAGRIDTAANTMYCFRYDTNGNTWRLEKIVAGTPTSLGTFAQTLTVDAAYEAKLVMRGTKIVALVAGVPVIVAVDAAISAAGKAGIRLFEAATSTVGVHLDNFAAYQGYTAGDATYVRDIANGVSVLSVANDATGTAARYVSADVLPLAPGSPTIRVSDDSGNIGTVAVAALASWKYL